MPSSFWLKSVEDYDHDNDDDDDNKPDIVIRDNENRTSMLIIVAISMDRNVIKKEAEKILNIKTLQ